MVEGHPLIEEAAFERLYEFFPSTPSSASNSIPCSGGSAVISAPTAAARKEEQRETDPWMFSGMFRARDVVTGDYVVFRHPYVEDGEGIPADAVHEMAMLKPLRHPSVVRLVNSHIVAYESVCTWPQTHPRLWLVFEDVCTDLRQHLKMHGRLTGVHLSQCVQSSLQGLDYCHRRGIVHRDIRPDNLWFDGRTRRLKIGGFASAVNRNHRALRPLRREASALPYRAPELLLGQRQQGPGCDIWSLACTVVEMATGQPLFRGTSEVDLILEMFEMLGAPAEASEIRSKEDLQAYLQGAQGMMPNLGFLPPCSRDDSGGTGDRKWRVQDGSPNAPHSDDILRPGACPEAPASSLECAPVEVEPCVADKQNGPRFLGSFCGRGRVGEEFLGQMLQYDIVVRPSARSLLRSLFFYDIRPIPELCAVAWLVGHPGPQTASLSVAWASRGNASVGLSRALHRSLVDLLFADESH